MIVLDTHAWVWWAGETGELSRKAERAISEAEEIGICTISCWEVAMLVERRRLELEMGVEQWIGAALAMPGAVELQLDARTATRAGRLDREKFPGDPADRIIYATALEQGARLISRDTGITDFDPARVLW